ncbi:ABC transporter ATP-binding protein [Flaviaesturariibacter aridisoli]|uniref:ABC transporter ATP-binding protein n=1 Tax=Flaviaesturariibacter aridisoli TaxID=2545761 RepID=A0A4R4DV86_9BACT|nr:ABC transporter ATP-binding protein [Flaviaesturariibacter aridisoli]TCZ67328.1 ABC transporter ATP-binding protein [Flaviaesturariibacter aridisoli]
MNTQYTIETRNLTYRFGTDAVVLQDINLQVPAGAVYGFLGPNGAGKTTTLRLLLGLLRSQEGSIRLFGLDPATERLAILRRLGSLIEQPSLYGHLTARENLEVYRRIYGAAPERTEAVLELVDLARTGKKKAKQFSLGMKQRLSIAVALLHSPELLILDEPTNGLDPNGIIETRELIKRLNREQGVTIIVSSHILAEVEKMATHVGIIHQGRMRFQGTLAELQALQSGRSFLQLDTSDNEAALQLLKAEGAEHRAGHLVLPLTDKAGTARVARILVQGNLDVFLLQPQQQDLEQHFIDITSGS